MADFSELQIQIVLTVSELQELVAMTSLAAQLLPEGEIPGIVDEISEQYFQLMESLKDGYLGNFQPE